MVAQRTVGIPQAVTAFSDLLAQQPGRSVGEIQADAAQKLGAMLRSAGIPVREPDGRIPLQGRHLILGVASFSTVDLQLLDELAQALDGSRADAQRVAVFDLQQCRDQHDVARYLPGAFGPVWNTPVLGIWDNGSLARRIDGVAGCRQMLQQEGLL